MKNILLALLIGNKDFQFEYLTQTVVEQLTKKFEAIIQESLIKAGFVKKAMTYNEACRFGEKHRCEIVLSLVPSYNELRVDGKKICSWIDNRRVFKKTLFNIAMFALKCVLKTKTDDQVETMMIAKLTSKGFIDHSMVLAEALSFVVGKDCEIYDKHFKNCVVKVFRVNKVFICAWKEHKEVIK